MQQAINFKEKIVSEDDEIFDKETIECLLKSEKDIEEGKTRKATEATEVIKEFEEKYEL